MKAVDGNTHGGVVLPPLSKNLAPVFTLDGQVENPNSFLQTGL